MSDAVFTAMIGFVSAAVGYLVAAGESRARTSKAKADAGLVMGQAWRQLFDELDERVKGMSAEICLLRGQIEAKDVQIAGLQRELDQLRAALSEKNGLVQSYEGRIKDLEAEVETLRQQLEKLGQKPRTRGKTVCDD